KKFADVTGRLARQTSPQNQFAIVLDGEVVSAPDRSQLHVAALAAHHLAETAAAYVHGVRPGHASAAFRRTAARSAAT
ncbi:hypothetical protein PV414_42115, partial [Streptomyces scabiei]|nr:hypothetical protein [Streptomyces scabiei]